jgi:hypothetical protein
MMNQTAKQVPDDSSQTRSPAAGSQGFVKSFWGVRYQVKDVSRSVNFYTQQLGFKLDKLCSDLRLLYDGVRRPTSAMMTP